MKYERKIIAIEGFDGTGKTTYAKWISNILNYNYQKSPSGTFSEIRETFDKEEVSSKDRLCFYFGGCIRMSMLLSSLPYTNFILDRYYYSTFSYHESVEKGITKELSNMSNHLIQPDIVLLFKTSFDTLNNRVNKRGGKSLGDDVFFKESICRSVYKNYKKFINVDCIEIDNSGTEINTKEQIIKSLVDYKIIKNEKTINYFV